MLSEDVDNHHVVMDASPPVPMFEEVSTDIDDLFNGELPLLVGSANDPEEEEDTTPLPEIPDEVLRAAIGELQAPPLLFETTEDMMEDDDPQGPVHGAPHSPPPPVNPEQARAAVLEDTMKNLIQGIKNFKSM